MAHDELGVEMVRAHAILDDDLGTYREVNGRPELRLLRHRSHLRPRPVAGPSAGRRAELHAARSRSRPDKDGLRLWGHRQPAAGLGSMGAPGARARRPPRGSLWPRRGAQLGVRGLERGEPRSLLVRHAGRVLPPVRDLGPRREGRGRRTDRRRTGIRGWEVDGRDCSRSLAVQARRSTSSAPTPTATRRSTCVRSRRAMGSPDCRSGGPSGAHTRATSIMFTIRRGARPTSFAAWLRPWAEPRRSRTGPSPTTSRSSAGRRGCSTAASACWRSAISASPDGGGCGCSSSCSTSDSTDVMVTARATWSRPSAHARRGRIAVVAWNGTVDVTKAGGDLLLDRQVGCSSRAWRRPTIGSVTGASTRRTRTSCAHGSESGTAPIGTDEAVGPLSSRDRLRTSRPERDVRPSGGTLVARHSMLPMPSISLVELNPPRTRRPRLAGRLTRA